MDGFADILSQLNRGELLCVIWIDALDETDWIEKEDANKPPKAKAKSYGEFLKYDEDYLYILWAVGIEGYEQCSRTCIPLGCIKNIEKIPKI